MNEGRLNSAIELLHFAYRALIATPDRLLVRRGLGRLHHRVLYFIARTPGLSVNDLLRTLGVTKQALNAPLRELLAQELIGFDRDPVDRRVKRLVLTTAGRRLESTLSRVQRQQFARAFALSGPDAERGWRLTMRVFAEKEIRHAGRWAELIDGP